jgi:hypothetical protein
MRRLSPIERTVEVVAARVESWNLEQLRALQRTVTQGITKAKWTFGSYMEDEAVAIFLRNKIASLERIKQQAGMSQEEQAEAEAQQLARSHGVSVGIARKHVRKAPPPAEPPTIFDERAELEAFYQRTNVPRNSEGSA